MLLYSKFFFYKSNVVNQKVCKKKYLSRVYGMDRKICHLGSLASLVMPISDPRDRLFYPHHTPMKDTYCLAHGLIQLTRDTKSDVNYLQMFFMRRNEKRRMTFGVGRHFKALIFPLIGKKNNQSLVSDTDRGIPTLGSTDNARNSVNLVSGIIRLPSGWDLSVCIGNRC